MSATERGDIVRFEVRKHRKMISLGLHLQAAVYYVYEKIEEKRGEQPEKCCCLVADCDRYIFPDEDDDLVGNSLKIIPL
jgi:hypothetical protein